MQTESIRILLVEDDRDYVRLMNDTIARTQGDKFQIESVGSLAEARKRLRKAGCDVMVLDLGLPDSTGVATVKKLHALAPEVPIVVLSGSDAEETVYDAMQEGAQDYVVKGHLAHQTLLRSIQYAVGRKRSENALRESEERYRELANSLPEVVCEVKENGIIAFANRNAFRQFGYEPADLEKGLNVLQMIAPDDHAKVKTDIQRVLSGKNVAGDEFFCLRKDGTTFPALVFAGPIAGTSGGIAGFRAIVVDITERKRIEMELQASAAQLRLTLAQTVNVLSSAIEIRDPYTSGHQRKVALLACAISREMGFSEDRIEGLRVAGVLHDIGKICVPSEILSKPSALTAGEYALIKTHAQVGCDILKNVDFPWPVADVVRQHHERMDGTGYPNALAGEAILPEARIIGVADVVEAMSSHRPYRPGMGVEKALDEVVKGRGTLYDPSAVDACLTLFRNKQFVWEEESTSRPT